MKAIITKHSVLTAVWHMLAQGKCCLDTGSCFFTKKDLIRTRNNAIHLLQALAYKLSLSTRGVLGAPFFRIGCRIKFATNLTAPTRW